MKKVNPKGVGKRKIQITLNEEEFSQLTSLAATMGNCSFVQVVRKAIAHLYEHSQEVF